MKPGHVKDLICGHLLKRIWMSSLNPSWFLQRFATTRIQMTMMVVVMVMMLFPAPFHQRIPCGGQACCWNMRPELRWTNPLWGRPVWLNSRAAQLEMEIYFQYNAKNDEHSNWNHQILGFSLKIQTNPAGVWLGDLRFQAVDRWRLGFGSLKDVTSQYSFACSACSVCSSFRVFQLAGKVWTHQ